MLATVQLPITTITNGGLFNLLDKLNGVYIIYLTRGEHARIHEVFAYAGVCSWNEPLCGWIVHELVVSHYLTSIYASLAQLVEQETFNFWVEGSNPSGRTK